MVVSVQTKTKETRLYNSMERTLGHIFALTLGIGPNNQIHSGYESFAGLFCMELSARLKMKSTESRIAILQRIWIWIQYTVRKVNFVSVSYDLYIGALNFHGDDQARKTSAAESETAINESFLVNVFPFPEGLPAVRKTAPYNSMFTSNHCA